MNKKTWKEEERRREEKVGRSGRKSKANMMVGVVVAV